MEPRKPHCGVDVVEMAEDHTAGPVEAWVRRSAGVEERGMYARVVRELGRSRLLHRDGGGAGAAIEVVQALGESSDSGGAKEGEAVVALSEGNEVTRDGG